MTAPDARPEADQRLTVFLSYSRDDLAIADQIHATLLIGGYRPLIDREGIKFAEEWEQRLRDMVLSADTVLVVLSPSHAASAACRAEVDWALAGGKRIIPVVCCPLGDAKPHPALASLNYIFLYPEPRKSGTGFGAGLLELREALNADLHWLREHTRLLQKATDWMVAGRPPVRLLSGSDIAAAKDWVAGQPRDAPLPTELHLQYIQCSEEEERRRQDIERQRLAQMAAAQAEREAALVAKEYAQQQEAAAREREALQARLVVRRTQLGLAAALLLAGAAAWFGVLAEAQRTKAERALQQVRSNAAARVEALVEQVALRRDSPSPAAAGAVGSDGGHVATSVADPEALALSAEAWLDQGQLAEARAIAGQGLAAVARSADGPLAEGRRRALAEIRLYRVLGIAAARQGSFSHALATQSLQTALDRAGALAQVVPAEPDVREALATALQDAGDFLVETAHAEAVERAAPNAAPDFDSAAFSQAQAWLQRLLQLRNAEQAAAPGSADARLALARAYNRLANLETVRRRGDAAEAHAGQAIALLTAPATSRPEDLRELCVGYYFMAGSRGARGQHAQALQWIEKVVRIVGEQAASMPRDATLQKRLSVALATQAEWLEQTGGPRAALGSLDPAIDAAQRAIDLAGRHRPEWLRDAAALLHDRARLLFLLDRTDPAIDALWRGLALREQAAALSNTPQWQTELQDAYTATRVLLNRRKRPAAALDVAEQQLFSTALAPCSGDADDRCREDQVTRVANTLTQLGWTALLAANPERALWATARALKLDPHTPGAHLNHAHALMLTGNRDEALRIYLEGPGPAAGDGPLKAWRAEVLDDFQSLLAQGVSDALMTEVAHRFPQ